ncbi:glycosyltransferase family 39 protein [Pseudomonadota bacterium]
MEKEVKPGVHPPGYHLVIYWARKWFGTSENSLRMPSVVAGILSIPMIYFLAKRIYGEDEGLEAAAFMAVLWLPVYYSQEARSYSLQILFSLISVWCWLEWMGRLRKGDEWKVWSVAGYVLSAVVLSYLHFYGMYFVGLQGLVAILASVGSVRKMVNTLWVYIGVLVFHLPWSGVFFYQMRNNRHALSWIAKPGLNFFSRFWLFLFNNSVELGLLMAFLIVLLLGGLVEKWRKRKTAIPWGELAHNQSLWLFVWLAGPVSLAWLISQTVTPAMALRSFVFSAPAAYILLARSVMTLPYSKLFRWLIAGGIVGVCLFHLLFRMDYYSRVTKQQYREATKYLVSVEKDYPDSLVIGWVWFAEHLEYYLERHGSEIKIDLLAGRVGDIRKTDELIEDKQPDSVLLIRGHRVVEPEYLEFLDGKFGLVEHKELVGADVWVFGNSGLNLEF